MQIDNARRYRSYAAALGIILVIFAAMCILSGIAPGAYYYPSYLLQAQAWLRGRFALNHNY